MSIANSLKRGNKFNLKGCEFEVITASESKVQYAACVGGQIMSLSAIKFNQLFEFGELTLDGILGVDSELLNLTEKSSREMNRKLLYVREAIDKLQNPCSQRHLKPIIEKISKTHNDKKPGVSTVARWVSQYLKAESSPQSLAPKYHERGNRSLRFDDFVETTIDRRIVEDYLTPQKINGSTLYSNIIGQSMEAFEYCESNEIPPLPSRSTVYRRLQKIDPYNKTLKRQGKKAARRIFRAAGKEIISPYALHTVQADGNYIDVIIIDENTRENLGRGYLTSILDIRTRCVIGYVVTLIPFSAATLLMCLKNALCGVQTGYGGAFQNLVIDNGSDFTSHSVKEFCSKTGVTIEYAPPGEPNTKANKERFYRTLNSQLIHNLPGTTYSCVNSKGEYESIKMARCTITGINGLINSWLNNVYHKSWHSGANRIPKLLWQDDVNKHPTYQYNESDLEKLARIVEQRRINNGRVKAYNLKWYSHALCLIEQQISSDKKHRDLKVEVYINPLDLSYVYVRDPFGSSNYILANSTNAEYTNQLTLHEHKLVLEEIAKNKAKDFSAHSPEETCIARWKLWKKITQLSDKHSKKQIARIEDSARLQNQQPLTNQVRSEPLEMLTLDVGQDELLEIEELDSIDFYDIEDISHD